MQIALQHDWNLTPLEAIALQKQLALQVKIQKPQEPLRYILGVDCAPSQDYNFYYAAAVLWDNQERKVLEHHIAKAPLTFPYVPGLLSFRELPAVLAAVQKVQQPPEVIMVDGHGIAHPRAFGIACHLGVLLNYPTFGCGKSRLYGRYIEPGEKRGAITDLLAKDGTVIGKVVRTRDKVKPVFVSIGNLMDIETAVNLVLACGNGYRLPEPTRQADRLVALKEETV